jgi:hypothetical protein
VLTIIVPLTAADLLLQLSAASLTIITGKSNNKCIHTSSIVICSMSAICCFVTGIIFNQIPFLIFTFLSISDFIGCCINILILVIIIRTISPGNNFISCSGSTDSVDNKQTIGQNKQICTATLYQQITCDCGSHFAWQGEKKEGVNTFVGFKVEMSKEID